MTDTDGWSPHAQATFCATLVDEWVRCGLTDAVVCPGSRSTPMTLALAGDDRVRTHVHHDDGQDRIVGTTDAANTPMRAAFERAGFAGTRVRIVHAQ